MTVFFSGLALGLSLIIPIGPQNIFVLKQGIIGGLRWGFLAATTAGTCDTLLIVLGAAGASALLGEFPWLTSVLLWFGTAFLTYLGLAALLHKGNHEADHAAKESILAESGIRRSPVGLIAAGVGVSWGNPHAILDTVAIIGSAIAAYPSSGRLLFASGAITASWLFFALLASAGALLQKRLTPKTELWVQRVSGLIMLTFAFLLGRQAIGLS